MIPPTKSSLTLAVHAITRGMGWIAFEGPFSPYDWGVVFAERDTNACLRRLERLFKRLEPETLVLERWPRPGAARSPRIGRLTQSIVALADTWGITVCMYDRVDVQACFSSVGARSREEIAEAVARHIDALRHLLPKRRRMWETRHPRVALFAAAALALTYYQHERLLEPGDLANSLEASEE